MMSPLASKTEIDAFLSRPILARLATANPANLQPHVTPVWFAWDGESLWVSGFRSTRKFRELLQNPRCSILVDLEESPLGLRAVLLEGEAEVITGPPSLVQEKTTWIYLRYLGPDGVLEHDPQSWIHDPENLVARLTPQKTFSWK